MQLRYRFAMRPEVPIRLHESMLLVRMRKLRERDQRLTIFTCSLLGQLCGVHVGVACASWPLSEEKGL